MVRQVDEALLEIGRCKEGDMVVIVAGSPPGIPGSTNALRIHRMGDAINGVAPAYRSLRARAARARSQVAAGSSLPRRRVDAARRALASDGHHARARERRRLSASMLGADVDDVRLVATRLARVSIERSRIRLRRAVGTFEHYAPGELVRRADGPRPSASTDGARRPDRRRPVERNAASCTAPCSRQRAHRPTRLPAAD